MLSCPLYTYTSMKRAWTNAREQRVRRRLARSREILNESSWFLAVNRASREMREAMTGSLIFPRESTVGLSVGKPSAREIEEDIESRKEKRYIKALVKESLTMNFTFDFCEFSYLSVIYIFYRILPSNFTFILIFIFNVDIFKMSKCHILIKRARLTKIISIGYN